VNRLAAVAYDLALAPVEAAGLARLRRALVAGVVGDVLEIGVGTGRQLGHYGAGARVVGVDPSAAALARARRRGGARLVVASAERLPFGDASFDWVVSALCLCGVEEPARAMAELARVLRPGGGLRALEQVRSPRRRVARIQRVIGPAWRCLAGCQLDRPTAQILRRAGFAVTVRGERLLGQVVLLEATAPR
jgi:ubiquinone/menaquinone biosynthesis C-methylase UbiE